MNEKQLQGLPVRFSQLCRPITQKVSFMILGKSVSNRFGEVICFFLA